MSKLMRHAFAILVLLVLQLNIPAASQQKTADAGPVSRDSQTIIGWATTCTIARGYVRIDDPSAGMATTGSPSNSTGKADNIIVSLGDGGIAVVGFHEPIRNNPGADFAVFENSFDGKYLELAFVEVSSDSIRWVRFPSISLTPTNVQTDGFGTTDPENLYNLAGKYRALFGTPFDLSDLADSTGIDLDNILYIRIVDVIGSINPLWGSSDSQGNMINDPWPTPFPQSGFDLDAIAVVDGNILGTDDIEIKGISLLYPIPAQQFLNVVNISPLTAQLTIAGIAGTTVLTATITEGTTTLNIAHLSPGLFIATIEFADGKRTTTRFIKAL
jgi:hypothetical protein